jgi:hypothetical protein
MSILDRNRKKDKLNGKANIAFEDGTLFVDCRCCSGASSLGNIDCVKCVSNGIANNGPPSRLLMRKENDVEHSDNVISIVTEISKIGSLIATASAERMTGGCKGCPCSLPKNAAEIWDAFPEPRFDIMKLEAERSSPGKSGCEECMWRTIGFIEQIETMFSDLRKRAAKDAFRLSEV